MLKETMLMIADAIGMIVFIALVAALVYFASGCGSVDPVPEPEPAITCKDVCRHAGDELACPTYVDQDDGTACLDWLCQLRGMPGVAANWQCIMDAETCEEIDACP